MDKALLEARSLQITTDLQDEVNWVLFGYEQHIAESGNDYSIDYHWTDRKKELFRFGMDLAERRLECEGLSDSSDNDWVETNNDSGNDSGERADE